MDHLDFPHPPLCKGDEDDDEDEEGDDDDNDHEGDCDDENNFVTVSPRVHTDVKHEDDKDDGYIDKVKL